MLRHVRTAAVPRLVLFLLALLLVVSSDTGLAAASSFNAQATSTARSAGPLRIVVLEGEDAVNIVQQRTAVAPVVEIRDRNDQPVAGAVVRFAVKAGKATFRGARTLSVTTNAAGRAAAEGLVPTGTGPLQIAATASYQGQSVAITIVQSNVATAAQAAGAAGGAGAGSGAGASAGATTGAASGSGAAAGAAAGAGAAVGATAAAGAGAAAGTAAAGISTTTLVVAGGAAVAGGTLVATKVAGGDSGGSGSGGSGTSVSGTFSGQTLVSPPQGAPQNCAYTTSNDGTLSMQYNESGGTLTGTATIKARWAVVNAPCGGVALGPFFDGSIGPIPLSGGPANITFTRSDTGAGSGGVSVTHAYSFSGSASNGVVTGTLTYTYRGVLPNGSSENGSTQMPVTLR